MREEIIKRKLKELKKKLPGIDLESLKKELIPLDEKEVKIKKKRI